MWAHAYLVIKEIGDVVFDCTDSDEWTQRLRALGKFDNGVSMQFSAAELADMRANGNLTPYEQDIVNELELIVEANHGCPVYLEYF